MDLLITVLITFAVLIGTYLLLSASRLVVNFFDKIVTPKLYKVTDKGSVVLKQDYEALEAEIGRLETKYQTEKDLRLEFRNENEQLEKRIGELLAQISEKEDSNIKLTSQDIEDIKERAGIEDQERERVENLFNKLKENDELKQVETIIESIRTGIALDEDDSLIRFLSKYDIIEYKSQSNKVGFQHFSLTDFGEKIADRILY